MNSREKGYIGEETAAEYLRSIGYGILERNYTIKGGETDIIAVDGNTLVFVEVKCRVMRKDTESPCEAVDRKKTAMLVRCARNYIIAKKDVAGNMPVRFDCIEVMFPSVPFGEIAEINHIKGIDAY